MKACPLCDSPTGRHIYQVGAIPVFQNKAYASQEEALAAVTGEVDLVQCSRCGFVYNNYFDPQLMQYDDNYQNEQAHSGQFRAHLQQVAGLLDDASLLQGWIVEIGCGKAFFLQLLWDRGCEALGVDPAYEGDDPRIIKSYFTADLELDADLIVLRHTLEHIPRPLDFLQQIAAANKYRGTIYIEVPCFTWIRQKKAFWDVFFEHCNYFTQETLEAMFRSAQSGRVFAGQYLYLVAKLEDVQAVKRDEQSQEQEVERLFSEELHHYRNWLQENTGCLLWGAGAKGATFANLTDWDREHIAGLIDINPRKQNRFVARSGHKISSPETIEAGRDILVMNENYVDEIRSMLQGKEHSLAVLGAL